MAACRTRVGHQTSLLLKWINRQVVSHNQQNARFISSNAAVLKKEALPENNPEFAKESPSATTAKSRQFFPDAKPFSYFVNRTPPTNEFNADSRPLHFDVTRHEPVTMLNDPFSTSTNIKRAPLEDLFGRFHDYLRISLTEKCNLRCQYCMPEDGVPLSPQERMLSSDEIIRLANLFVAQGVRKVRLTGGEPLVRKDIVDIIGRLRENPKLEHVAITTNGLVLTKKLPALKAAGLTQINISLDTLKPDRFEQISRRKGHDRVCAAIDAAIAHGYTPCKINCVMMRNVNEDELLDFIEFTRDKLVDFRFIEYMPFDGNKWQQAAMVPYAELISKIQTHYGAERVQRLTDRANDTSKAYKIDGYAGQFGFISSMTEHFCGSCNRVRLTADGNLKVCLFGNSEVSLRDAMRSGANDAELVDMIGTAVGRKKKQHAGMLNIAAMKNRPMILIGNYLRSLTKNIPVSSYSLICCYYGFNSAALAYRKRRKAAQSFFTTRLINTMPSIFLPQYSIRLFTTSCTRHIRNSDDDADRDQTEQKQLLTHVNAATGKAEMVDVGNKAVTRRQATAEARVYLPALVFQRVKENAIKKGDVLSVAQLAGIMGAKQTSTLIPLCHNISIGKVHVECRLVSAADSSSSSSGGENITSADSTAAADAGGWVLISCTATCSGKTGIEMEALTGASVSALCIYDMCKALSHDITFSVRLVAKTGGKTSFNSSSLPLSP